MNFQSRESHSSPLFRSNHILKREDKILTENILFISKLFNNLLVPIFPMFTIITQPDQLLMGYLSHPIQLILMEAHPYLTRPTQ